MSTGIALAELQVHLEEPVGVGRLWSAVPAAATAAAAASKLGSRQRLPPCRYAGPATAGGPRCVPALLLLLLVLLLPEGPEQARLSHLDSGEQDR